MLVTRLLQQGLGQNSLLYDSALCHDLPGFQSFGRLYICFIVAPKTASWGVQIDGSWILETSIKITVLLFALSKTLF